MEKLIIYKSFLLLFSIFFFIYSVLGILINKVELKFLFYSLIYFISSVFFFHLFFLRSQEVSALAGDHRYQRS